MTAALRVTDGALVVVDCIESVCVQTETVLRQAITERIRPVLFLNKLDRVFLETKPTLEDCYNSFRETIESVNVTCETYRDEKLGNIELWPQSGRVGFGSGLHAWGFTLDTFAAMYCSRFGISMSKLMNKLWGNHYWDPSKRAWTKKKESEDGTELMRGFCQFVLWPMKVLFDSIMDEDKATYEPIIRALGLQFSKKDLEEASGRQKDYLKLVMRSWLPAGDALLNMIVDHLPSPIEAQPYRVENLYSGPMDSPEVGYIAKCDKNAPLSMYISSMLESPDKGAGFIALGRVFSGSVKTSQEVRILGPDYEIGGKKDLKVKKIQRVLVVMAGRGESISEVPAGSICGIVGIDKYLEKSGTLTTSESFHPFVTMKFSVAAVVQIAVKAKNAADLPKLVEGLRLLSKSDQLVKTSVSKTGEHIIAGAGELHLEICLNDLRDKYVKGAELIASEPVVSYAETITTRCGESGKYPETIVAKSANRLNRLYVTSEALSDKFVEAVESGEIKLSGDLKTFARKLADEYDWDSNEAKRIWSFGCPPDALGNALVDSTKGASYMSEVRDHIVNGFMQVTECGVLANEVLRAARFDVIDSKIHSDSSHRGAGQLIPCAAKAFYGAQLASNPRLLEPMYLVDITVPRSAISGVFSTLGLTRGETESITDRIGTPLSQVKAYLPVAESFGFTELLRKKTSGQAFPQMKFSHWKVMDSDPMLAGTMANAVAIDVRRRKGMKESLPIFTDYYDKM